MRSVPGSKSSSEFFVQFMGPAIHVVAVARGSRDVDGRAEHDHDVESLMR